MLSLSQLNGFNAGRNPYIIYAVAGTRNAASTNGITWTEVFPSTLLTASGNSSRQTLLANNYWFGEDGTYVSQDIQTSGSIATGLLPITQDVAYGAGVFVAVGLAGGLFKAAYGSSLGGSFTLVTLTGFAEGAGSGVDFVNGLFIAVSSDGYINTSSNGSTWNLRYSGGWVHTHQINKTIDYGNGEYCVNGDNDVAGGYIYSADGVNWTAKVISGFSTAVVSIIYWKGVWYAFDTGTKVATTTTPGTAASWTVTSTTFAGLTTISGVSYTPNRLVLFGSGAASASKISYGVNGINWTAASVSSVFNNNVTVFSVPYQRI